MQLLRVTIAVNQMQPMVTFYNRVLEANLSPFEAAGATFYRGSISGLEILLCPNEIARVDAKQNRKQLTFVVPDLRKILETVESAGGHVVNQSDDGTICGVSDPDGNTLEFIQQS
jgi:predicted enzyme related to lactoylglutathione lyase